MDSILINVKTTNFETHEVSVMDNDALQKFAADVAERSATVFADVWKLGQQVVFKAYGSTDNNSAMFTAILNSFRKSPRIQDALYDYWKRAGINASRPAPGSKSFLVGGVLDRAYQEKAFNYVLRMPPMPVERTSTKPKGVKTLKGTAVERARDAVASLVKRIKKDDPHGAAAINEMLQEHDSCLFDAGGAKHLLDSEEMTLISELLQMRINGEFRGFKTLADVKALKQQPEAVTQ